MAISSDFNYTDKLSFERANVVRRRRLELLEADELVIEYEDIQRNLKEEAMEWLEANRMSFSSSPTIGHKTIEGTWNCVNIVYNEQNKTLRQQFYGDAKTSAPITEASTQWILGSGENYRGSNNSVVLRLLNVDKDLAEEIINENTDTTYTNSIYTADGGLLSGTWHNINCQYVRDPQTGLLNVEWFLSKQANDDVQFAYQQNECTYSALFYKFDAADTGIESLKTDYYFDSNGDWYISTDGSTYTEKNGVTESGSVPSSAKNLSTDVAGRTVDFQMIRNERSRFYIARVEIDWHIVKTVWHNYLRNDNERVLDLNLIGLDVDTLNLWVPYYYFDDNGDWYYSTDGANYTIKNGTTYTPGMVVTGTGTSADTTLIDTGKTGGGQPIYSKTGNYEISDVVGSTGGVWLLYDGSFHTLYLDTTETWNNSSSPSPEDPTGAFWSIGQLLGSAAPSISQNIYTLPATAFNATQQDTNADYRRIEIASEQNQQTKQWLLRVRVSYITGTLVPTAPDDTVFTGSDSTSYGTPLVTVTDTVVSGASALPASAGSASYNADGTKLTEYQMLSPRFDPRTGTYTYTQREIITWAPHADQDTGAVGYIEGPSEIRRDVQTTALAKGIGSGFASLGSWAGGGQGRIKEVATGDGPGSNGTSDGGVQATKGFVPYNVTVSRYSNLRTSSRMYFYVKEPIESEYPAAYSEAIEKLDSTDLTNNVPYVTTVQVYDDDNELFGAGYAGGAGDPSDGWWVDDSAVYGKISVQIYSDGIATLQYWKVYYDSGGVTSFSDNVHWRELDIIRTYQGSVPITAISDAGGGDITCAASTHGYSVGDPVIITGTDSYDGYYEVTAISAGVSFDVTATYVASETGTAVVIDDVSLKAGSTPTDDSIYVGHYVIDDTTFYTEAIRHRIVKMAENVYAFVVETIERTPWQWDNLNKWMLNTEGYSMQYATPASNPATNGGDVTSNVPYIM